MQKMRQGNICFYGAENILVLHTIFGIDGTFEKTFEKSILMELLRKLLRKVY